MSKVSIPSERRFKIEIATVLVVKAILISILWAVCFSTPPVKDMSDAKVAAHVLNFKPTQPMGPS